MLVLKANIVVEKSTPNTVMTVIVLGKGCVGRINHRESVPMTQPEFASVILQNTYDHFIAWPFFKDAAGSYLTSKTGLLTLNLSYDTATLSLVNVTGSIGTL